MKITFTAVLFIFITSVINAQTPADTSWKKGGFIGINFNQVNLSQWAPGGESSLALSSTFNLFANYVKDKNEWANSLDLVYAMIKSGDQDLRKSDDKIDLNSKYGRKLSDKWLLSALLNFKSQFAPGYNYPDDSTIISNFFSPAYLTLGIGVTYKPVDYFEVFISPATAKFTFVNSTFLSDIGAYGVEPGENMRSEFGAYLNMKFKKDIMENITLTSKLELFNNYTDEDKDNAKRIDVNWDSSLNLKVNDYITAILTAQVVYDADIIERTQYKQTLGIGLGMKF
jgi:hypothetical protein